MDGITSIGGDVVEADTWGADVAIVGSQKCLAAPAGLAGSLSVTGHGSRLCKNPPFYLDLAAYKKSAAENRWRHHTHRQSRSFWHCGRHVL